MFQEAKDLSSYISDPNTAPPEKVALIAPIVAEVFVVLKKSKKLGDWITMVMTPESYPKRKLPVAAKMARQTLKMRPILIAPYGNSNSKTTKLELNNLKTIHKQLVKVYIVPTQRVPLCRIVLVRLHHHREVHIGRKASLASITIY